MRIKRDKVKKEAKKLLKDKLFHDIMNHVLKGRIK